MTVAVISKGQQASTPNLQQQVNELFTSSNKPTSSNVEVHKLTIVEKSPNHVIVFPTNDDDDDDKTAKFPPQNVNRPQNINRPPQIANLPQQNANLILQSVDQKFPAPAPNAELTRPTRVAVAATSAAITNRHSDDQFDYIREFGWTMFQVSRF